MSLPELRQPAELVARLAIVEVERPTAEFAEETAHFRTTVRLIVCLSACLGGDVF